MPDEQSIQPAPALTLEQQAAACAPSGHTVVKAGPGTGKTTTLIERYCHLIDSGADPDTILVTTFTRKAADEIKGRIAKRTGIPEAAIHANTIHSFGRTFYQYLTGNQVVFASHTDVRNIQSAAGIHWPFQAKRRFTEYTELAVGKNLAPDMFLPWAQQHFPNDEEMHKAAELYPQFYQALEASGKTTFDTLLYQVNSLMDHNPDGEQAIADMVSHVLIDEVQDSSTAQIKFIQHVSSGSQNVWAVGDDDQALYGWRQGDRRHLTHFNDYFPNAHELFLTGCFRCSDNIVKGANTVIKNNLGRSDKTLSSHLGPGLQIQMQGYRDEEQEAAAIAATIRLAVDAGMAPSEIAVLNRTKEAAGTLTIALMEAQVPINIERDVNILLDKTVGQFLTELSNLSENGCDWIAQTISPRVIKSAQARQTLKNKAWAKMVPRLTNIHAQEIKQFRAQSEQEVVAATIKQLEHVALTTGNAEKFFTALALNQNDPQNCVNVGTLHGSKGLEYSMVFLTALEEGLLPHRLSNDICEERNLLFVGMTRAKTFLNMSFAAKRNGRMRAPSHFLTELTLQAPAGLVHYTGMPEMRPDTFAENKAEMGLGDRLQMAN